MRYIQIKDEKTRIRLKEFEIKYLVHRYITQNLNIRFTFRMRSLFLLNQLVLFKKNKCFLNNLCILTTRSRSIYKKLFISRLMLRKQISIGKFPGFKKINY